MSRTWKRSCLVRRAAWLMPIAAGFSSGCLVADDEPPTRDAVIEQGLYANKDLIWPTTAGRTDIAVCWDSPNNAPGSTGSERAAWRDARRRAVEEAWGRNARINFYGWDGADPVTHPEACPNTTATGIHIRICNTPTDSACPILPASQGGVSMPATGALGFVRFNRNHGPSIMVHEVGHALGLYHEEERPDAPNITSGPCAKQSFPNNNPILFGAYDPDSIMSYCSPPSAAPWLSANDVAGIQRAYGRRVTGSLVTPRGNCAAAHWALGFGDRGFTWDCDEANRDQRWGDVNATSNGDAWNLAITGVTDGTQRCLGAASATAGAAVQLAACTTATDWRFENVALRGMGNRCLDVPGGNTAPGTVLQMFTCGALGGVNQTFTRTRAGQLRFGTSTRCVRINAANRLELGTCSTADPAQLFSFAGGVIKPLNGNGPQCLDVVGPSDAEFTSGHGLLGDGAQLQLMPCNGLTLNQKFEYRGALRYDGSPSLCLSRGSDGNGSQLSLSACTAGSDETQTWDFYF